MIRDTLKRIAAVLMSLLILVVAVPMGTLATDSEVVGWDGTVAVGFDSGSGTYDDPYMIMNGEQLALLAANVNAGMAYEYTYFELGADIVLNDTTDWQTWGTTDENGAVTAPVNVWTPIGNDYGYEFAGDFNGNGYTIKGLYVYESSYYGGLFAKNTGYIENVTIEQSFVGASDSSSYDVGGVVGYLNGGTVNACTFRGRMSGYDVGGIVGESSKGYVVDCVNEGTLISRNHLGGIVGHADGGTVRQCVNKADITVTTAWQVGGIVGYGNYETTIVNCVNEGALNVTGRSDSDVGGIVGDTRSNLYRCINRGNITVGEGDGGAYAGGIAGRLHQHQGRIAECVNEADMAGDGYLGGLVGEQADEATMIDSLNLGDIDATLSDRYDAVGGLVGGYRGEAATEISNCYTLGNVTYNADSRYYGALIGRNYNDIDLTSCYYLDTVIDADSAVGTALTAEQLADEANFDGWNFKSVWEYDEEHAYPTLRCFGSEEYYYRVTCVSEGEIVSEDYVLAYEEYELPTPEWEGHTLYAWQAEDVTWSAVIYPERDIELHAVWKVDRTSENAWDGSTDTAWAGSGTENDPYLITTPAELAGFALQVNTGNTYSDAYFLMTQDILLNDGGAQFSETIRGVCNWNPIGNGEFGYYNYFKGTFDGGNHTVSGLYCMSAYADYVGLFGKNQGTVRNLHIKDAFLKSQYSVVGALAGWNEGTIENVTVDATVIGEKKENDGNVYVGGAVGKSSNGSLKNVTVNGNVIGHGYAIGGIAGESYSSVLSDCANYATVETYHTSNSGGLIGTASNSDMIACENYGSVNAVDTDKDGLSDVIVGGLVGSFNTGIISGCANHGDLSAMSAERSANVGGLCGRIWRGDRDTIVSACYNTGDMTATANSVYMGGLFEQLSNNVQLRDCYTTGSVDGSQARWTYIGGIASVVEDLAVWKDVYYLDTTVESSRNDVGEAKTAAELAQQSTYDTWNFKAEWEMGYKADYDYPTPRVLGSKEYYHAVSFEHGDASKEESYVKSGASVTFKTSTKSRYPFAYWEDENGKRYAAGDTLTVESDMAFTAVYYIPNTSANAWDGSVDTDWDGSGTADDPYLITSVAELAGLANGWYGEKHFLQTKDLVINDHGKKYHEKLIAEQEWTPIGGKDGNQFGGYYDGGGHTISGLFIKSDDSNIGLFGSAINAIKNLHIRDSFVYAYGNSDVYQHAVGAVCGEGSAINCTSNATVIGRADRIYVGGLVGRIMSGDNTSGCVNNGNVTGEGYYVHVGGVVGNHDNAEIVDCVNTGVVTGIDRGQRAYIGGVAGESRDITACRNDGTVNGIGHGFYLGGVVGYAYDVTACVNNGDVTANANGSAHSTVGGVAGDVDYLTDCHNYGPVTSNCYGTYGGVAGDAYGADGCTNSAAVTVNDAYAQSKQNHTTVSGIIGSMISAEQAVQNCINIGNLTVEGYYVSASGITQSSWSYDIRDCANHGNLTATASQSVYAGGIAADESRVTGCYADGDIAVGNAKYMYVGGIGGSRVNVKDCYVNGTLQVVKGENTQQVYLGGIVGDFETHDVVSSYAAVTLVCDADTENDQTYIDGVANNRYEEYLPVNCYYLQQDGITSAHGTALTDEQMQVKDSFVGFDFENAWEIGVTEEYAYPTLQNVPHIRYIDVVYMVNDTVYNSQKIVKGEDPVFPDMTSYMYEKDGYVYRFDHWDRTSQTDDEIVYTAVIEKVAKLRLQSIDIRMNVENGYSRDNLRVDIESLYSRLVCETTTGYRVSNDVVWDMSAYDPDKAGDYVLVGQLSILNSPYYELEEGAAVTLTVTVGDGVPQFDEADLTTQELEDGTLKITGYNGNAAIVRLPQTIDGKTVTVIGENAFADNAALVSVVVPNTVITIEASAFENCTALCEVAIPEGVKTIGDRAFYNTALVGLTVPASVMTMGETACGFFGETASAVDGFTVYAYADSAAATYAEQNGFVSVLTQTAHDEATDIQAVIAENVTLAVAVVTEGEHFETASEVLENTDGVSLFEISVFTAEQDSVQPENMMTISIPVPDGFTAEDCRIYRINDDGSFKDMGAQLVDGRLVFHTSHLSYYAILDEGEETLLGDLTNDGTVNMMDVMNMYNGASGKTELTAEQSAVSDMNGDGVINMMDVMALYNRISGK